MTTLATENHPRYGGSLAPPYRDVWGTGGVGPAIGYLDYGPCLLCGESVCGEIGDLRVCDDCLPSFVESMEFLRRAGVQR